MSFTSERSLWISITARAVSLLGDEAALIALTLRMHDAGGGPGAVAALFVAGMVPLVACAPLAGRLIDRYDSRRLLLWSGLAQAGLCLVLAGIHGVSLTLALVALLGAGQAVNGATWQALIPALVGPERLPATLGWSQSARTAAGIAAPAIAGLLAGRYGTSVPLLLDAATFVAVAGAGLLVCTTPAAPRAGRMRGGYAIVRDDAALVTLLAPLAGFIVLGAMVNVVEVFLVRDTLSASATWYGVVGGTWAAGMLLGSLLGGRWHRQPSLARVIVCNAVLLSLAMSGYAAAPSVAWLLPVAVAGGAANGLLNLGVAAMIMLRAPEDARGRVSATVNAVTSAALIGAYLLGGVLATVATPRQLFLASGLLGLLAPMATCRRLARAAAYHPQPAVLRSR
ncbi:MAG TPA: MFS transporter [Jatrophihabitantaceae bacterium]|jgi:MFS family permease